MNPGLIIFASGSLTILIIFTFWLIRNPITSVNTFRGRWFPDPRDIKWEVTSDLYTCGKTSIRVRHKDRFIYNGMQGYVGQYPVYELYYDDVLVEEGARVKKYFRAISDHRLKQSRNRLTSNLDKLLEELPKVEIR